MSTETTPDFGGDFPANDLETALHAALEGAPGAPEDFLARLRAATVWVPVPEGSGQQDDGSVALPSVELEGVVYIPVFTSRAQYDRRSAEVPGAELAMADLAEVLPSGVGLAVNPGNEASVPIGPESVAALAGGEPAAD
ncbi:SseB family protein [Nocardiopsis coralliicola]